MANNSEQADREAERACRWAEAFAETALPELEDYLAREPQDKNNSLARLAKIKENFRWIILGLRKSGAISPDDKARIANAFAQIVEFLALMAHDLPHTAAFLKTQADARRTETARNAKAPSKILDAKILELADAYRASPGNANRSPNYVGDKIKDLFNDWLAERIRTDDSFAKAKSWTGASLGRRLRDIENRTAE